MFITAVCVIFLIMPQLLLQDPHAPQFDQQPFTLLKNKTPAEPQWIGE